MLLGPSGAGKTTTLRVIAGLETARHGQRVPDTGSTPRRPARPSATWRWCSRATRCTRSRPRRRTSPRRCGRASCPSPRSTRRSSASPSCCTSRSCSTAARRRCRAAQMQRVALGRALVRDPRAFLMDEPLTNLDLKLRVEMRTELTRIHRSLGRTFLYVTNDQVEAMSMADQVAVLRAGNGPAGRFADRDLRPPGEPLGGHVRRLAAHEPPQMHGERATRGSRAGRSRIPASGFRATARRSSASARRTCRWRCARSRRRWTARSTPSSRWAIARWSTSRSAISGSSSRRRPTASFKIGEQVRASVDMDRVHLFDADTESAIARA